MKQLVMITKLRNNRLYERRVSAGMSGAAVARAAGISEQDYCALEGLKDSARTKGSHHSVPVGSLRKAALALCKYWNASDEELFPPDLDAIQETKGEIKADVQELALVIGQLRDISGMFSRGRTPEDLLDQKRMLQLASEVMTDREFFVFDDVTDGATLTEASKSVSRLDGTKGSLSVEATRHLFERAAAKLRHAMADRDLSTLRGPKEKACRKQAIMFGLAFDVIRTSSGFFSIVCRKSGSPFVANIPHVREADFEAVESAFEKLHEQILDAAEERRWQEG